MSHSLADSAVYYINSQLGALWQNAIRRAEQGVVEPSNRVRDDIALREYSIRNSNNELIFSAIFDKPRIDFACSHEAAFYLKIVEGYFTPYQTSFEVTPPSNVAIKDLTIVFRIDYKLKTIVAEVIANKTRSIQSLSLDVANATLASNFQDKAFISYLKKYLQFLHSSGQIALFFLPEFNEDGDQVPVSFAPRARFLKNMDYEITEIHGLGLKTINGTLFEGWLKSIIEAEDLDADLMNEQATCLSECRTTWTTLGTRRGIQFWAKFGPPKLKILCKCEGILTFFIEDLVVLYGDNSRSRLKRSFRKWEIPTMVDVIEKVEGSTTTVKLDLKTLRVFKPLCNFSDLDMSVTWAAALKSTIFEFFESHYTTLLQTISADVLKERTTTASPYQTPPRTLHSLKETSMAQYDFIHVFSVEKTLQHFHTLLNDGAPSLAQWSHGDDFTTSFGPVRLTFTSHDKALFWIHLKNGSLKSSENNKRCTVTDWLLAFELPIILAEHAKVVTNSPYWFERFQGSYAWKSHGNQPSRCLHHLYLDFSNAKFVYNNSGLGDLAFDEDAPGHLLSAVNMISKYYFKELINHGYHILFSFPVWKAGYSPPPFGVTSLTCQTYSKYTYTCKNIDLSNAVLAVLGMTSYRKHPEGRLPYTSEWVLDGRIGTVCLSRRIFLDDCLLKALAMVNGATTVVPNLCLHSSGAVVFNSGAHDGWRLAIATLVGAAKDVTSEWSANPNKSESDFIWRYSDDWENNHTTSRGPFRNGCYTVSCTTKNLLSFSTPQEGALNIILKGDIGLVFKGNRGFNARLDSTWSTTLSMKSRPGGGGLSFEISGDNRPQFRTISTDTSIEQLFDVRALQNLINVDLHSLASQLCQRFGGRWEHGFANAGAGALTVANPMFNKNWDILLELRFHSPLPEAPDVVTILPPAATTDYNEAPVSNEAQNDDNALGSFDMAYPSCAIIAPGVEDISDCLVESDRAQEPREIEYWSDAPRDRISAIRASSMSISSPVPTERSEVYSHIYDVLHARTEVVKK